jgi:DNA gyrase subunit A
MSKILEVELEDELKTSYLDYAVSVIVGRAIPDARDGLKPVQRRILYAMKELNLLPNRPFRKSATVVGEVIGKYHPHGDQAVYEALVRLAQDFTMRYPLIQGQGNFGSIDGDPPSAYRYTEARLSQIALEVIGEIDEDTVDFVPNFDGQYKEPVILASKFPNLLANGSSGIAVGMATNIPSHNLTELMDACIEMVKNPNITVDELLKIIKGPDFPTGGYILGYSGLVKAYKTGQGRITIRSKYRVEKDKIIITEIPYEVKKAELIKEIADLVKEGKVEGIANLRDESDKDGLRIVITLKKGADPSIVENQLLKYSNLQRTYSINMLALVGVQPKVLNLKEALEIYINHRKEVLIRRTKYRLSKALHRLEIVEGLIKAINMMDRVVKTIRESESVEEARKNLISMGFSELQANSILEMRLSSLTKLQLKNLTEEREKLQRDIKSYKLILESEDELKRVMIEEFEEIKRKYGDKRKTVILKQEVEELDVESLIKEEEIVIIFTRGGYAKRLPLRSFKRGVGKTAVNEDDVPSAVVQCSTHDQVAVITSSGAVFWTKAYNIPETSTGAKGKSLRNIFKKFSSEDKVVWAFRIPENLEQHEILILSGEGRIKRVKLSEVLKGKMGSSISKSGILSVLPRNDEDYVLIASKLGKAYLTKIDEIPLLSRSSKGVVAIKGEPLIALPVKLEDEVLVLTEDGYIKRMKVQEIPIMARGNKTGVYITPSKIFTILRFPPTNNNECIVLTEKGTVNRITLKDVPLLSRTAKGVRLINLSEGDRLVDAVITEGEG